MYLIKQRAILAIIAVYLFTSKSQGQGLINPKEADGYYIKGDYQEALSLYNKLLEEEPTNINYHYKIGMCYLNSNIDKGKSIPYFEWITKQPKFNYETWYELGVAYHYAERINDAIQAFEQYKQFATNQDKIKANKQIEECNTAKKFMLHPVNVTIENLGKNINSPYPDYYPIISNDEATLIFTTRRPGRNALHKEMDGYYSSDIFISHSVNGVWQKAENIGSQINTSEDEEAVGLNLSANELIIYKDNIKEYGNLYISKRKGNQFLKPERLPVFINSGFQSSGSISDNGKVFLFASERPGGYGGTDIYLVKRLPNGKWGSPQNLGAAVNTAYNEDFPMLDADMTSLYFSSQGHNTMGDYDLFESKCISPDSNIWSAAQNLGYPINTSGDDRCISFTKDHHVAYVSRQRPDGYGDLDIYKITFNDTARYAIIKGTVSVGNPAEKLNTLITATNCKTKERFYFKPIPQNGHYIMALLPGVYDIYIQCKGYIAVADKMVIYNNSFKTELMKNYTLKQATTIASNSNVEILFPNHKP